MCRRPTSCSSGSAVRIARRESASRSSASGTPRLAEKLFKRLEKGQSCVLVRYPVPDDGGAEDLDRVRWLAFFSLFGFAPDTKSPLQPNQPWVLYKRYPETSR